METESLKRSKVYEQDTNNEEKSLLLSYEKGKGKTHERQGCWQETQEKERQFKNNKEVACKTKPQ